MVEGLDFGKVEHKVVTCRTPFPGFLHLKEETEPEPDEPHSGEEATKLSAPPPTPLSAGGPRG